AATPKANSGPSWTSSTTATCLRKTPAANGSSSTRFGRKRDSPKTARISTAALIMQQKGRSTPYRADCCKIAAGQSCTTASARQFLSRRGGAVIGTKQSDTKRTPGEFGRGRVGAGPGGRTAAVLSQRLCGPGGR